VNAVLHPSEQPAKLDLTERTNAVVFLSMIPACAVVVIVCLFHLGVL
jgi:hypothetical protein